MISNKFSNIDEYVKNLKERNLIIHNEKEFKKHLFDNNIYVIKEFEEFFINKKTGIFLDDSVSIDLINLYNFDYDLSIHIISYIFKIERRLSGAIINAIMKSKNITSIEFNENKILKLGDKDFLYLFPHLKEHQINEFKKILTSLVINDSKTLKKFNIKDKNDLNQLREIPFYILSKFWTLSVIQQIIENTRKELKIEIMKYYFNTEERIEKNLINAFVSSINVIRTIRNQICHNKPIYNIEIKRDRENLYYLISKLRKKNKSKGGIFIFEVCLIIDYFSKFKSSKEKFIDITNKIRKKYDKLFQNNKLWNIIVNHMKF